MDFNNLVASSTTAGSIANYLNHNAISSNGTQIVQESEAWIYRRLRHWQMLTSTNGTLTASATTVTVPADFLEEKFFKITGSNSTYITRKTIQEVVAAFTYDGSGNRVVNQPTIYYNDQTNFQFDSPCDQIYPFLMPYYQQPLALSATNTSNFITTTYPRLMRSVTCMVAAEFMKDSGLGSYDRTYWAQQAQTELDVAQAESDRHERGLIVGAIFI